MTLHRHGRLTTFVVAVVLGVVVLALGASAVQAKPSLRQFVKKDHFVVAIPAHPAGAAARVSTSLDARGNVAGSHVTGTTNGIVIGIGAAVLALLVGSITFATFRGQPATAQVTQLGRQGAGRAAVDENDEDRRRAA
jgi:hypothetical protein